jgi:predicted unusual protein kinase regulating ubiquinone biosynthesis (AarF/ABC1/UbiB family)
VTAAAQDAFERIDAVVAVGLRLARSAPSGRLLLARIAEAIDPAWLPEPWDETLAPELAAAHRAALEPLDRRLVEAILHDAWGAPWNEELDALDLEPVAVTPAAQVHRGALDGRPVAVKLLRPGLAATVRQDLTLAAGLLAPLSAAFPALDPAALVREFRERVLDELDLEHEAATMRRFHRALRGHPYLGVPAPVTRLARETVLVSEFAGGVPLGAAPDREQACARLLAFVLGAARFGLIHADPDPHDVLVDGDGRLTILDFGAVAPVPAERAALIAEAVEAFVAGADDAFGRATQALGWLPRAAAPEASGLVRDVLGSLAGENPVRLDHAQVLALRERADAHPDRIAALLATVAVPAEDLWPARGVAQLFSTIARVGATGRWRELVRAALRDGWNVEA